MKKYWMVLSFLIVITIATNVSVCIASSEFTNVSGKCIIIDENDEVSSKYLARKQAIYNALEKTGIYIEGYSHVENLVLVDDMVESFIFENISIHHESYSYEFDENGNKWMVASLNMKIDSDKTREEIQKRHNKLRQNYEEVTNSYVEAQNQKKIYEDKLNIYNLYNQSIHQIDNSNYQEALSHIESIPGNDTSSFAWSIKGDIYKCLSDYEYAIDCYTRAIKLDFRMLKAYLGRGDVYYIKGDYQKALVDYNVVVGLNRSYSVGYKKRGATYEKLGNMKRANEDFKKSVEVGDKK